MHHTGSTGRCLPDGVGDAASVRANHSYARLHSRIALEQAFRLFVFNTPASACPLGLCPDSLSRCIHQTGAGPDARSAPEAGPLGVEG
jgi:hypothetical protein